MRRNRYRRVSIENQKCTFRCDSIRVLSCLAHARNMVSLAPHIITVSTCLLHIHAVCTKSNQSARKIDMTSFRRRNGYSYGMCTATLYRTSALRGRVGKAGGWIQDRDHSSSRKRADWMTVGRISCFVGHGYVRIESARPLCSAKQGLRHITRLC